MQLSFDLFNDELVTLNLNNLQELEPWEMTCAEFLSMSEWKAYPDPKATQEHKGNYVLQKPNGKMWPSGWIGKFKSEEQAKKNFHEEQIYYKLHWNSDVVDRILADYPKLLDVKRKIHAYMKQIYIGTGDYVRVDLPEGSKYFHRCDFPMYCRVSQRGFVRNLELCHSQYQPTHKTFHFIEVASIALFNQLEIHGQSQEHRPQLIFNDFSKLFYSHQSMKVRLLIPVHIDQDGNATSYSTLEVDTSYNFSFCQNVVKYPVGDEVKTQLLLPSQVIAYQDDQNQWINIQDEK